MENVVESGSFESFLFDVPQRATADKYCWSDKRIEQWRNSQSNCYVITWLLRIGENGWCSYVECTKYMYTHVECAQNKYICEHPIPSTLHTAYILTKQRYGLYIHTVNCADVETFSHFSEVRI